VGRGPLRGTQDPFEVVHRLAVELPQRGRGTGPVREVHETSTDFAENDRVVGDPLEASGGRPKTEPLGPAVCRPQLYRGDALDVPSVPVDLVVTVFPVPVVQERKMGPTRDRFAVELGHEPPHPRDPLVERDLALEREVAQVDDPGLVRDDLGLAGPSAERTDDLAGARSDVRTIADHKLASSGKVGAQKAAEQVLGRLSATDIDRRPFERFEGGRRFVSQNAGDTKRVGWFGSLLLGKRGRTCRGEGNPFTRSRTVPSGVVGLHRTEEASRAIYRVPI